MPVTTPSTPTLVAAYADRFTAAFADGSHQIGSPLGSWLLVALAGTAATGADREALTEILGTDPDDALARAAALLEHAHPAVAAAAALWHVPAAVESAFDEWAARLPRETETGAVPSQEVAADWAKRTTHGIIDEFPVTIDAATIVVLANALATRVTWKTPFWPTGAEELGGVWPTQVEHVLHAADGDDGHEMLIVDTERAGRVGVHAASSDDGLLVVSVIADPAVAEADAHAAAHDVASVLARRAAARTLVAPTTTERRSLFELPLGEGHAWTITEREIISSSPQPQERYAALLPAWRAESMHELGDPRLSLGFNEVFRALERLYKEEFAPFTAAAKQAARARYDVDGFEAAAVSGLGSRARGMSGPTERAVERNAEIRFARPYAVVAIAVGDSAGMSPAAAHAWHGVPVFSAWVTEPTEPAPMFA